MNLDFFEKIDTPEKAQILGFYWADGCLLDGNQYTKSLTLALSAKDLDYMEWIKSVMGATYPIHKYTRKNGRDYIQMAITDPKPIQDVQRLGLHPRKSLTIGFPSENQVPTQLINSFVLGVFEGDGCIHLMKDGNGAEARFCATINFNDRLRDILHEIDIESYRSFDPQVVNKNFCLLSVCRKNDIIKLMNWMYRDTSYRMKRKYKKFCEFASRYDVHGEIVRDEAWKMKWWKRISRFHSMSLYAKSPDGKIYHTDVINDFASDINVSYAFAKRFFRKNSPCISMMGWTHPTEEEISLARSSGALIEKMYRTPKEILEQKIQTP